MPRSRSLLLVVLAVALSGPGVWLVIGSGQQNADGATGVDAVATSSSTADLQAEHGGNAAQPAAAAATEAERRTVAASAAVEPTVGILGQVIDALGKPVAAARVVCRGTSGFEFDPETFDPDDIDMDTMRDRFRNQRGDAVETKTDAQGKFRVAAPGSGRNVQLRVHARAHLVLDRSVPRPTDRDVDLGALTVQTGAVVSGRVLDRAGQAVADARVSRRGERTRGGDFDAFQFLGGDFADRFGSGEDARTDGEGRFELEHAAPGNFALVARHEEHPPARLDGLTVAAGGVLPDVVLTVEPGTTIRGKLVDVPKGTAKLSVQASIPRTNEAPGNGILAMLGDTGELIGSFSERTAEVAADGTFALRGLAVGQTYRVWATQRGRGFTGNSTCSQRHDVMSGVQDLELRYEAGVTVTFTVADAGNSAPIEKLWIGERMVGSSNEGFDFMSFAPNFTRPRAYPDGRVTIANLRPKKKQTLTLAVEALGFAKLERKGIELPLVGNLDLGALRLEPAPVVKVRVRGALDGAPIAGATVQVRERRAADNPRPGEFSMRTSGGGGPQSAKTDAEGMAVVNGKASAKVAIGVTSRDFAPYESEDMTLTERGAEHEARLLRGGTVEVTAIDADGKPARETTVDHKGPGDVRDNRRTNAAGVARFEHLTPGKHQFKLGGRASQVRMGGDFAMAMRTAGSEATASDWEVVDVIDEGNAKLDLAKAATASLSGFVRENAVPLAGAQVSFVKGTGESEPDAAVGQVLEAALGEFGGDRRNNNRGRTDDLGNYALEDLPVGEHRLRVAHRERAMQTTVRISLRAGRNVVDVELATTILRGTVLDHNGKPVADATMSVSPATASDSRTTGMELFGAIPDLAQFAGRRGKQVSTDAQGRYELRGVEDSQAIVVRAQAKGFAAASSKPVQPVRGATTENVDVQLLAAGSVRVRATTQGAFGSVQATCTSTADLPPVTRMLRKNEATIEGLQPGTWRIALLLPGGDAPEPRSVSVVAGQTVDVSF